jgi:hypothetical protein
MVLPAPSSTSGCVPVSHHSTHFLPRSPGVAIRLGCRVSKVLGFRPRPWAQHALPSLLSCCHSVARVRARSLQDMCIDTIFQCHCMDEEYSASNPGYRKKTPGAPSWSPWSSLYSFVPLRFRYLCARMCASATRCDAQTDTPRLRVCVPVAITIAACA